MTDRASRDEPGTDLPDEAVEGADPEAEGSVLSSLPRTRPGVRSPRRSTPRPTAPPGGGDAAPGTAGAGTEPKGPSGLEGIALEGIRAAAEAAETGIRIGRWAAGALRGAVRRD